ncbi:AFG1 family ATPase [Ponticoccus sp. SC2-23]|uniref:cell division protein ZapE n=1 Tax=Alexandriicola marinus TaxID=2081710 RepID=UPI000FDC93B7|nr:cell division protein ZapE [Alexandriicola marinus]MBM1221885.1 AFG1 family ATPase [Ponticoccus sp. SC6-9]MBM1226236.1 AFG1 family ATPase [Ponticoccus sp. SC6-15]MBM1230832.1 AFG1 family ATPase [Ponticoccus sp. SC6-38]MBM1235327.1 AFG1 family ATPase [Ponticoccus sp. SC6-45]MBM1239854.1 AFG1 family ATPase [Ponticoccus sp. SC6-49]MBM1243998.1 AFG1 family ATPase [Ponticoccus sp. SC2-64]MBM1248851.1 AFG1 family ATPase [Ponticoccus sp. SC6-42]MBM1253509.1 AFG1 family ATPase [Ponticoccus sp. S
MTSVAEAYSRRVADGRLNADPVQEAMLPDLDRVRSELERPVKKGLFRKPPPPVRGLYLWGGVGRGKSMLMDLLFETVTVPKQRRHFHAFMQWVHAEMGKARKRGVDDAIAPVADQLAEEVRFLAFDEMQITDITDAMIVGRLFQRIFDAGVTVVTTSNRPPRDLYKDGLNRDLFVPFIEMIEARMDVVEMASDTDHRQGRLKGTQTYFTPIDATARAEMNRIWDELTDGQAHPEILRVHGRDVEIPGFYNGAARARFYDLCGRPLGPADYLALAGAAKVILIDDIPQLGSMNFNEAKRFVTLIDALYEGRVRLICSAAARPEMLYVEGEGSFEFGRTASRLEEMQSEDWGRA